MKGLVFPLIFFATPAFAHHEVVVTTSLLPLASGLAIIGVAALTGLQRKYRKRILRHRLRKTR